MDLQGALDGGDGARRVGLLLHVGLVLRLALRLGLLNGRREAGDLLGELGDVAVQRVDLGLRDVKRSIQFVFRRNSIRGGQPLAVSNSESISCQTLRCHAGKAFRNAVRRQYLSNGNHVVIASNTITIYVYIYTYKHLGLQLVDLGGELGDLLLGLLDGVGLLVGLLLAEAKDSTPEIHTSESIVDFQWHFPMGFQWHFPTELHLSVVFSKGLSLSQWITGIVQQTFSGIFQWNFTFVISGV